MPRLVACLAAAVLLAAMALAGVGTPAAATTPKRPPAVQQTEHVRAELIAARDAVTPGERIRVGLHQKIRKGWHTYWRNPGDSGLPTQLTWALRDGARAGPTLWPAPSRFVVGPLVNYGYADEVVLMADLEVPAQAQPGEAFAIVLSAAWLVCEEICIPEEAELSLTLPIAAARGGASAAAALLDASAQRLPQAAQWASAFAAADGRLVLHLALDRASTRAVAADQVGAAYFFVDTPETLDHAAPQRLARAPEGLALQLVPASPRVAGALERLSGVVALETATGRVHLEIAAARGAVPPVAFADATVAALPLWQAVLFAFLGGLLLNLMPCVLPVLSMKALALMTASDADRSVRAGEGISYGAGVIASFGAIAATVLALRSAGVELGWGFQFQSPAFVGVLAAVMLGVALSMSGVFHVGAGRLADAGAGLARRGGRRGAFLTGLLAVVVATPCTAPFMGAALGVALLAPAPVLVAVLLAMAIGLALPFVLLSLVPGAGRWLPKPGAWMERLKQALAFPMYATCAWLVWVLSQQVAPEQLAIVLAVLVGLAFGAWLYGATAGTRPGLARLIAAIAIAVALACLASLAPAPTASGRAGEGRGAGLAAVAYDAPELARLRGEGRAVFVNMTAAWCITCLVNERAALASDAVRRRFEADGVVYMVGDWTRRDPAITAYLRAFGRVGVPLYVAYSPGGGEPVVLPQLLTETIVLDAVRRR